MLFVLAKKRGHKPLNYVVSDASIDTGKVLDISIISKDCRCPNKNEGEHTHKNVNGSNAGMDVAEVVQIFQYSEKIIK